MGFENFSKLKDDKLLGSQLSRLAKMGEFEFMFLVKILGINEFEVYFSQIDFLGLNVKTLDIDKIFEIIN